MGAVPENKAYSEMRRLENTRSWGFIYGQAGVGEFCISHIKDWLSFQWQQGATEGFYTRNWHTQMFSLERSYGLHYREQIAGGTRGHLQISNKWCRPDYGHGNRQLWEAWREWAWHQLGFIWYRTGKHHSRSQIWQGIVDTIQSHRKFRGGRWMGVTGRWHPHFCACAGASPGDIPPDGRTHGSGPQIWTVTNRACKQRAIKL